MVGVRFCSVEAFGAAHRKLHIKSLSAKIIGTKSITLLESPQKKTKLSKKIIRVARRIFKLALWWILPCVYRSVRVFKNLLGLFGF